MRGRFHAAEYLVEFGAVKIPAVQDDRGDFLGIGNVFEGGDGKQNEVGELPFFDGSGLVFHSEKTRGINSRGLQRFKRSESSGHETQQFLVEAVARENMNTGGGVRSPKKRH